MTFAGYHKAMVLGTAARRLLHHRRVPIAAGGILASGMLLTGCSDHSIAAHSEAVVYDTDDRQEWFEESDPALQELARSALVALVYRGTIDRTEPSNIELRASSSGVRQSALGLPFCPSVPFQDQASVAFCSGVLVDDDLVLTAAHCMFGQAHCRKARFVFDYFHRGADTLEPISEDDIYSCRGIVAENDARLSVDGTVQGPEVAIVQLDRPVVGRTPVALAAQPAALGEPLFTMGFPSGVPAKLDRGGSVLKPRQPDGFFRASVDTFAGNSGSGVFRHNPLELLGVLSFGEPDFVTDMENNCAAVNVLSAAPGTETTGERISDLSSGVAQLCDAGFESQRLCGVVPTCGDGQCGGIERHADCPTDCAAPMCGDGVCTLEERTGACPLDCGEPVPETWTCDPGLFDGSNGCDRFCGAPDPDCNRFGSSCSTDQASQKGRGLLLPIAMVLVSLRTRRRRRQCFTADTG